MHTGRMTQACSVHRLSFNSLRLHTNMSRKHTHTCIYMYTVCNGLYREVATEFIQLLTLNIASEFTSDLLHRTSQWHFQQPNLEIMANEGASKKYTYCMWDKACVPIFTLSTLPYAENCNRITETYGELQWDLMKMGSESVAQVRAQTHVAKVTKLLSYIKAPWLAGWLLVSPELCIMKLVSVILPSVVHMMGHSYTWALLNTQALVIKPARNPIINKDLKHTHSSTTYLIQFILILN